MAEVDVTWGGAHIITHFNCTGCGRFVGDVDLYLLDCPNCGADNRP